MLVFLSAVEAALAARLGAALRGGDVAGVDAGVEAAVEGTGLAAGLATGVAGRGVVGRDEAGRGVVLPPSSSDPEWLLLTSVRVTAGAEERTGRCGPGDVLNRMGCVKVTGVAASVTGPSPGDNTACARAFVPTPCRPWTLWMLWTLWTLWTPCATPCAMPMWWWWW